MLGDSVRAGRDGGLAAGDTGGGGARGRGAAETGSCRDLFHTGWPLCAPPPMLTFFKRIEKEKCVCSDPVPPGEEVVVDRGAACMTCARVLGG